MRRNHVLTCLCCLPILTLYGLSSALFASNTLSWQCLNAGVDVSEVRAIAIDTDSAETIYLGSKKALYRVFDKGKDWELLGSGLINNINFLVLDKEDGKIIYAATENGLFRSQNSGRAWKKIFSGKDALEQDVLSIALCYQPPKTIFIATKGGVFFSPVNRLIWQKVSGKLNDASIVSIVKDPHDDETFYILSSEGLFKSKNRMSSYEKIYGGFNPEYEDDTSDVDSEEEEVAYEEYHIKHLVIDPQDSNKLYLATRDGLLHSYDAGKSWQRRELTGLLDKRINYLLVSSAPEVRFFLATPNGVFDCQGGSCQQLYSGADFKDCSQLSLSIKDKLYAACDKGLYVMPVSVKGSSYFFSPEPSGQVYSESKIVGKKIATTERINKGQSPGEPAIREVQEEAIKYAEVHPEKIATWRRQARMKAFIPEFTLDYDKTVATGIAGTYDKVLVGPRDWGMGLKWNLADLIFSTDQTSIDVRSRLMVQLRDDILNEVTRLYFERKRLQLELGEPDKITEQKARTEKELRLQELTAFIDGLTGGYFSRVLGSIE